MRCFFILAICGWCLGCGETVTPAIEVQPSLMVEVWSPPSPAETGKPVFAGIGVFGRRGLVEAVAVAVESTGPQVLNLPAGTPLEVRLRRIACENPESCTVWDSSQRLVVGSDSRSIHLQLGESHHVQASVLTGSLSAGGHPAGGWTVRVVDPFTGAHLPQPSAPGLSLTSTGGDFSLTAPVFRGARGAFILEVQAPYSNQTARIQVKGPECEGACSVVSLGVVSVAELP